MKKMAEDHWNYVRDLLIEHGETHEIIEKCGFHYRTAFEHGAKHGVEAGGERVGIKTIREESPV